MTDLKWNHYPVSSNMNQGRKDAHGVQSFLRLPMSDVLVAVPFLDQNPEAGNTN